MSCLRSSPLLVSLPPCNVNKSCSGIYLRPIPPCAPGLNECNPRSLAWGHDLVQELCLRYLGYLRTTSWGWTQSRQIVLSFHGIFCMLRVSNPTLIKSSMYIFCQTAVIAHFDSFVLFSLATWCMAQVAISGLATTPNTCTLKRHISICPFLRHRFQTTTIWRNLFVLPELPPERSTSASLR